MLAAASIFGLLLMISGCPVATPSGTGGGDMGSGTGTDTGTDTDSGGTSDALGYDGTLSGRVSTVISSADATGSEVTAARWQPRIFGQSAQTAPTIGANAAVTFTDLDDNPLVDADGNPHPPVPLNSDGTFTAQGLPVGMDFVVNVDLDGDGEADLFHVVNIPKDETGPGGHVDDVNVNPLTTMAVAKLKAVLREKGVRPAELTFSPSAVINQLIRAFSSLFELMGIDSTITADQIMARTIDALAEAFDELVPDAVKTTMDIAVGRLDVEEAESPEELVLKIIPILLRAGFLVADEPGGVRLDPIADLPDIEVITWDELWGPPPQGPPPPSGQTAPSEDNRIFRSTVVEVDRNFAMMQDEFGPRDPGLIIRKHALERIAGLAFEGKTLSLGDLYTLATSLDIGMGMRLTYPVPMPPPQPGQEPDPGPPPMMFQSADRHGVEVDMQALDDQIRQIWDQGFFTEEQRKAREAAIRGVIKDALAGTVPPPINDLFGGILSDDEFVTFDKLAHRIRNARAHVPFNWSGPAQLFVLADRDRWRHNNAHPVTVDIMLDADGQLARVTYNPNGDSKYYLRVWGDPEWGYTAEVVVAATGRTLFAKHGGPVQADPFDESIFQPVRDPITGETVSFAEAFSETGENWPIEPALVVTNPWMDPTKEPDPAGNPPTITIPVLVTEPGPNGEVVTVRVDPDGTVVRDTSGDYALQMFWEGPPVEDWMANLVHTRTGQMLLEDPNDPGSPAVRVRMNEIVDLEVTPHVFTWFYDIEVPNPMYNPEGDPWYDDINDNDRWDPGEPTFDHKEELWQAGDWRSTNVTLYYRRADNDQPVDERDINWDAPTPQTWTGVALVPRNFKRRPNAFAFGRPNSALSLLTAFLDPDFFDGTHKLNAQTRVDILGALAMLNLVFDARLYNLEAYIVDYGPEGPLPAKLQIVEAHPWVPPIDDPIMMVISGFEQLASSP